MRTEYLLAPLVLLLSSAWARDPFAAPDVHCRAGAAAQWVYKGRLNDTHGLMALLQGADGTWRRVRAGDALAEGLRITGVTHHEVAATAQQRCLPGTLRWIFQEKKHEGNPLITVATVAAAERAKSPGKSRLADGRRRAGGSGAAGAGRK
ncbi:HofP DNA utilization family protein [Siccibacter colletis]|uniref:HofP DNA utilization family protein n=1 Tax=Siccibacter colletis TaxID=1505757 RepID=UPI0028BD7344|nr:HofP DNA utilization family protein [Siccibacter colletis]WNN48817.1 HofP DNA utilization family protein [Siccibacter colletis]